VSAPDSSGANFDGCRRQLHLVSLPAGIYSVSVEATGFKKAVNEKVTPEVAQKARLDYMLQADGVEEIDCRRR
jgi:hypothetical protein